MGAPRCACYHKSAALTRHIYEDSDFNCTVGYGCTAENHHGATHPVAFMNITPDSSLEVGFVQLYAVSPNASIVHITVMLKLFATRATCIHTLTNYSYVCNCYT